MGRYAVSVLREVRRFSDGITVFLAKKHRGISKAFPKDIPTRAVLPPDYFMYMSLPRFFFFLLKSAPPLVKAAREADLIHCLCDYPFSFLAWRAGRKAKKPVIVSGHGTYSVAPFRYPVHRNLIRKSYGGADAVLFGSDFARQKFEEHAKLPNVEVVDYGVDTTAYAGEPPPRPETVKGRYILCIGEVKERKGYEISVPLFLRTAEKHPDLTFAVVGFHRAEDPYFKKLNGWIQDAGLEDRVMFLGNVSEEEKHALYAHSECFLLTPKESAEGGFEALGLVYLEAGACGVPVIGTLDSGAVCAIRDGENGYLFPPDKPEEGAKALCRILEDDDLKRRLGNRGRQMARERAWGRVGEKIERIYRRCITGRGAAKA